MIETIPGLPEGILGFTFRGQISGQDYDDVLVPAMERAIEEHDRIKALLVFGEAFAGYDLAALWDDTRLGLRHWRGFERIAVVSDVAWVRTAVRALGVVMPGAVRLFAAGEEQEARRWLAESLGTIRLDNLDGVIRVRLIGQLEPQAYDGVEEELTQLFASSQPVRLLVDLREFDGWSGLAALGDHLSLVGEHRRTPQRVAVVGDQAWQKLVARLLARFNLAETQFFDAAHAEQAELWVRR